MKILNPTYDTVFKYLLEDLDIAKGLIERIIDKEIVDIMPLPQEKTGIEIDIKYMAIPLHRQDFVVAIKTENKDGSERIDKVMVEMQKSPFPPEITRFRQYLSDKYHHRTKIDDEYKDLPIKTIYLIEKPFNKNLPAVLHVKNEYYDRLTGKPYEGERDEFVDLLVHEAYFIQTALLPLDMKNDLLRVLSIFSPRYQITLGKEKRFIEIDEAELNRYKDKLINLIIRRLSLAKEDNKLLTALDIEIDYENRWERLERERNEYKKRVEQERKEKEEIKERLINTAKIMKNQGIDIETIKQATGLSEEEIKKL